jgi:hypothetical protein
MENKLKASSKKTMALETWASFEYLMRLTTREDFIESFSSSSFLLFILSFFIFIDVFLWKPLFYFTYRYSYFILLNDTVRSW